MRLSTVFFVTSLLTLAPISLQAQCHECSEFFGDHWVGTTMTPNRGVDLPNDPHGLIPGWCGMPQHAVNCGGFQAFREGYEEEWDRLLDLPASEVLALVRESGGLLRFSPDLRTLRLPDCSHPAAEWEVALDEGQVVALRLLAAVRPEVAFLPSGS